MEKLKKEKKIRIGKEYYFNTHYKQVFYKQTHVKLSKKELQLLKILLKARGNIVPFEELEHLIWDKSVASVNLRILIHRLRKKLTFESIETFPSFGCKIKYEEI